MKGDVNIQSILDDLTLRGLDLKTEQAQGTGSHEELVEAFFAVAQQMGPTLFCDIGAYDGSAAARFKKCNPDCRTFAFEANPYVHARFAEHHTKSGVDYRNLAIDEQTGVATIYLPPIRPKRHDGAPSDSPSFPPTSNSKRSSLLQREDESSYIEFDVPTVSLDAFLSSEGLELEKENVVLWIDAEGAGHRVLRGAPQTLARTSTLFIETEMHEYWKDHHSSIDICWMLVKHGLWPVGRDRQYGDKQFNMLFVALRILGDVRFSGSAKDQLRQFALSPA